MHSNEYEGMKLAEEDSMEQKNKSALERPEANL